jgi:hypothetical protein
MGDIQNSDSLIPVLVAMKYLLDKNIKVCKRAFVSAAQRENFIVEKPGIDGIFVDKNRFHAWVRKMTIEPPPGYVTRKKAGEMLGLSHETIYGLVKKHSIPFMFYGLGRGVMYLDVDFLRKRINSYREEKIMRKVAKSQDSERIKKAIGSDVAEKKAKAKPAGAKKSVAIEKKAVGRPKKETADPKSTVKAPVKAKSTAPVKSPAKGKGKK